MFATTAARVGHDHNAATVFALIKARRPGGVIRLEAVEAAARAATEAKARRAITHGSTRDVVKMFAAAAVREGHSHSDATALALRASRPGGVIRLEDVEAAARAATAELEARAQARRRKLYANVATTGGFPPEACRAPQRRRRWA
jgi:hypothetical protein